MRVVKVTLTVACLTILATAASAETCTQRANICKAACTPALVSSGEQYGGTVAGCNTSCQSRLNSCLRSGIWVHMGSQNRGLQQKVDKR